MGRMDDVVGEKAPLGRVEGVRAGAGHAWWRWASILTRAWRFLRTPRAIFCVAASESFTLPEGRRGVSAAGRAFT